MTKNEMNNIFKSAPDVLTLCEFARILKISQKLASRLIKDGKLEAIKVGRSYRIAKINAIRYILGEYNSKNCVQSETSNPKDWTCGNLCGMVCSTEKTLKKEAS